MYIHRQIETSIKNSLNTAKIIVLYGARQVGKTTLVREILKARAGKYINCDLLETRQALESQNPSQLRTFL
ncbi:AAA family ATPase, partial [Candidatus Uhrbacteria bacterium]|nr:AAA family ATPase [Candidatus Uhrbacteria bacterium]